MNAIKKLTFENTKRDFTVTLNNRVNEYFRTRKLSRHANFEMVVKTIIMMLLYFGPYALIIVNALPGGWLNLLLVVIMSMGLSGIGLAVMHDGNHGAYSKRKWINTFIGYSLNLIGANSFNWKVQHNVLHHTFTNVHEADEDIGDKGVLRLTPKAIWKRFHRYQYIYAWFFYGLMSLFWMTFKDFAQLARYQRNGLIKSQKTTATKQWIILVFTKVFYINYIFIIPLLFTPWVWWQILLGIFVLHYITGFMLAIIFQPAHVIEGTEFPEPDTHHSLKDNWAIHQLRTTTNFANNSRWFTWFVGGLNFQIEHHLFPGICHVHYRNLSVIVQDTAREYGIEYRSKRSFLEALQGHLKLLKQLGLPPAHHQDLPR